MDPTTISPEIVNQIVEAVTRHAPSIWAAGSAAAVTAAETLGKGALSKLGGDLVGGLIKRLRGKSKEAPKDRAEIERIVREVLQSDPGFAQQVQVCFQGPVAYPGGVALQFLGSAYLQFGESGATAAAPATAPAPAATPTPRAILYVGIAEPLVEMFRSWLVTAPEQDDPQERAAFLGAFPQRETGAYGFQLRRKGGKIVVLFQTPEKASREKIAKLVEDWAKEAPKELQTASRPIPALDSRRFAAELKQRLQGQPVQVITRFGLTLQRLQQDLTRLKPDIVLLSCHGTKNGELILEDGRGLASVTAGDRVFEVLKPRPQVLFLDACHSQSVLQRAKQPTEWTDAAIVSVDSESPIEVAAGVEFQSMFFQRLLDGARAKEAFEDAELFLRNSDRMGDVSFGIDERTASEKFRLNEAGGEVQLTLNDRADEASSVPGPGPRLRSPRLRRGMDRFVGRHRERADVLDALLPRGAGIGKAGADRRRLVTLTKEGGIGKTAMAAELSDWVHERGLFPAGVFEVSCEEFRSPAELLSELLTAFGVPPEGARDELLAGLQHAVSQRAKDGSRALLVLDNLDDLIGKHVATDISKETERIVETLVGSSPDLHILATCRWPLGFGENEAEIAIGPLSEEDSRDVFLSHVTQAEHELEARQTWTQPESPIRRLIKLAGRHPHALRLLARQLGRPGTDLAKLAEEARENLLDKLSDPLATGDEEDRRLKVKSSFELSYRHLSEEAKRLFGLLQHFPGGVWFGDSIETLMEWEKILGKGWKPIFEKELDYYALVHVERDAAGLGAGFYRMLPAMVELSRGKTQREDSGEAWTKQWVEFWKERLSLWNQLVSGKVPEEVSKGLDAAARAAAGRQCQSMGVRLLAGTQGNWLEVFEFARKNAPELCKWILLEVEGFTILSGQRLLGNMLASGAVAAARKTGNDELLAPCLGILGNVQSDLGERDAARASYEEALEIRRRLAAQHPAAFEPHVATTLNNLGTVQSDLGERDAARASYEEALEIYRRLAEQHPAAFESDVATTLNNLGNVQSDLGERDAARGSYEKALKIYRRLAEQHPAAFEPYVATTLNNLGTVQSDLGERDAAQRSYKEALKIRRRLAEQHPAAFEPDVSTTLNNLGTVQSDLGERDAAQRSYKEALKIRRRLAEQHPAAFEPYVATTLNNLGHVQRDLGEREAARASYRESLELYWPYLEKYPRAYMQEFARPLRGYTSVTAFSEDDRWWQVRKRLEAKEGPEERE